MSGVNKVILIGNVGKDPEVRATPTGAQVASLTLATSDKYKNKAGATQERTEWHNVILWGKLAGLAGDYVKKGSKLFICGRIETSSWEDKSGRGKMYKTEIVASEMQFLSPPSGSGKAAEPQKDPLGLVDNVLPF